MRSLRAHKFLRGNCIFYLTGILLVLGIKYYYSQADCDSLLWILTPTTRWVEFLSGIPFTYISGTGYVNHDLRLLIAPSCSGVQFMIITIATLVFSFVHIAASSQETSDFKSVLRVCRGMGWIAACMVFSWLFTIMVNGLRIIVAIYLPLYLGDAGLMGGILTSDRLHTVIGVVVYFTALLTLYRLVDYTVQRKITLTGHSQNNNFGRIKDNGIKDNGIKNNSIISRERFLKTLTRKCIPPIFWYFLMTLGLPFLNRAYLKSGTGFMEFAILIICCIVLVLLPYCVLSLLYSQKVRGKKQISGKY